MTRRFSLFLSRSDWWRTFALYLAGAVVSLPFGATYAVLSVSRVPSRGATLALLVGAVGTARVVWVKLERWILAPRAEVVVLMFPGTATNGNDLRDS
jgi:hypothetical protein